MDVWFDKGGQGADHRFLMGRIPRRANNLTGRAAASGPPLGVQRLQRGVTKCRVQAGLQPSFRRQYPTA